MKKSILVFLFLATLAAAIPAFLRPLHEPPILMYHRVGYPDKEAGLFVTPESFERQMEFLKSHNYRVWSLEALIRAIKAGEKIPMNVVVITFDDGYLDNFKNAFPVLKKMDFPATIFMITGNIGKDNWLAEEDLRILDGSGVTIGSHTVNHAFLPNAAPEAVVTEVTESKAELEAILGHPVSLFSYPAGGVSPAISLAVQSAGYQGAVTTNYGVKRLDPFSLHRVKISDARGNLFNFWIKTGGFYHLGKKRVEAKPYGA